MNMHDGGGATGRPLAGIDPAELLRRALEGSGSSGAWSGASPPDDRRPVGPSPDRAEHDRAGAASLALRPAAPAPDPLAPCILSLDRALVAASAHHGRAVSPAMVKAGLPLDDERLPLDALERAAERAGLRCAVLARAPAEIPQTALPALVQVGDDAFVVLAGLDPARDEAALLDESGARRAASLAELAARATGIAAYLSPRNPLGAYESFEEARAGGGEHWFWSVLARFWPTYLQVAFVALVLNLLALALPLFTMNIYDRVVPNFALPTLWSLSIGVMIALGFDLLLRTIRAEIIDVTGKKADFVLASRVFEHVLSIRLAKRPQLAGLFANQVREFETVREFFTSSTLVSATDLAFIAVFVAVSFALVGPLTWVTVAVIPLVIGLTLLIQIPLGRAIREAQREAALRHAVLIEAVNGLETIKAVGGEGRMQRTWEQAVAASSRSSSRTRFWASLAIHSVGFVQQGVTVVTLVWGVYLVADGTITMGALIAASMLGGRALAPLAGISATLTRFQQTVVALNALEQVMGTESDRPRGKVFLSRPIREGAVRLEGVTFTYPGAAMPALKDVSLDIRPGERVGIIGRMGSGKTTVGRLVANLYAPEAGAVYLDGADVRQLDPADVRAGVGFVAQDPELFAGSLRDNIAFGRPGATDEQIVAVARLAGVDEFASRHPAGYDMPVGERGRTLSGGQRQTVALARTLLREPRVLYLDEPSGAMDAASEATLIDRLIGLRGRGVTLVISTHRHSLLRVVDRLVVFDGGRIAADGPRDEVLLQLRALAAKADQERQAARAPGVKAAS